MLGKLVGGLVDKESIANDMISSILEKVSEENNLSARNFFIAIKAIDNDFNIKLELYSKESGQPRYVKDLSLNQLLKDK